MAVTSKDPSDTHRPTGGLRFARSRTDAILTGVAGGLGERWGVEGVIVRIGFGVLTLTAGLGLVAYLIAWALALEPNDPTAPPRRAPTTQQAIALGLIVLGAVLVLRSVGLWFGDAVGIPLLLAAIGTAVIYVRTDSDRRPDWTQPARARGLVMERPSLGRVLVGGALVVIGVAAFLAAQEGLATVGPVLLAVIVTSAGLLLVFGPWVVRLVTQLGEERRDRIRSEERAEMAAHLHDSVLQTLALIQRNSSDPRRMVSLARRQERELRSWLYGQPAEPGADERLEPAVQAAAQAVEEAHDVPVEAVVVGDCPLDERVRALVHACREAAANAARHSGAPEVSVYVECEPDAVNAFVRDRGRGFDPNAVPGDRRGIADSIRGRVQRHGGEVQITSAPGEGCEVHIRIPTEAP